MQGKEWIVSTQELVFGTGGSGDRNLEAPGLRWVRIVAVILPLLCLAVGLPQVASAHEVSGQISGEWRDTTQPCHMVGDITAVNLTIGPGVRVLFRGSERQACRENSLV